MLFEWKYTSKNILNPIVRYRLKQTTEGALSVRSFYILTHIWSNSKSKSVLKTIFINSEAVARRCSIKKMFLQILQTSRENTCARIYFLIKRLWRRCFPVIFAKFLRTPFLTEHLRSLLLKWETTNILMNNNWGNHHYNEIVVNSFTARSHENSWTKVF